MASAKRGGRPVARDAEEQSIDDAIEEGTGRRPSPFEQRLSMIALAISVIALVVAVFVPGPGTIIASGSHGGIQAIQATCTHYAGAEVTIRVPGAGTVVVTATVGVGINHTLGTADEAWIAVATSATECALSNSTAFVSVPPSLPTDPFHYETVPLLRTFPIATGGSLTVYVNGVMAQGANAGDRFDSASLVAAFYPR